MKAPGPVVIRRAAVSDALALAESRFRFRSETNAAGPLAAGVSIEDEATFIVRATSLIAARLGSGRWFAWIADSDGRVSGHIFLQEIDKLPNPSPDEPELIGYLTSFYVEAPLRGSGVGSRLLDELESHAAERGLAKIIISGTTPLSRPLYARRGYESTPDMLEKRLVKRSSAERATPA